MEHIQHKDLDFYKWSVGPSTFLAWPEKGARLMHWYITMADGTTRDVIHWPDNPNYDAPRSIRGGNPILFPFVARSYYKGEENFWSPKPGIVLPMPRHGFAVDGCFEILDKHPRGFSAKLKQGEETQKYYPFNYSFIVKYHFGEFNLSVDLILKNEDTQPIPWGAGHHFYFHLPWHTGLKRNNYSINIPSKKGFYRNTDGSLCEAEPITMPCNLSQVELLDCMHSKLKAQKVSFGPLNGEETIQLQMSSSLGLGPWATITTWTENESSPFYCIEPWLAPANAAEHKKGLVWVEPGSSHSFSVFIDLK